MHNAKYENVQKVFLDVRTGETTSKRIDDSQVRFDSQSEYKLFQLLCNKLPGHKYILTPHVPLVVNNVKWVIDFQVQVADKCDSVSSIALADLVNRVHGTHFSQLNSVYFEYKGLQDNNFKRKMKNLLEFSPMMGKTLILVSSEIGAFCEYSTPRDKLMLHPILSLGLLHNFLKNII